VATRDLLGAGRYSFDELVMTATNIFPGVNPGRRLSAILLAAPVTHSV
jgi:hypothetical protein